MTTSVINLLLASVALGLTAYNLRAELQGAPRRGKIARAVGPVGYLGLLLASLAMIVASWIRVGAFHSSDTILSRAALTLQFIIAVDNFFNGDDPPRRRRRQWVKNKFYKLAPVRAG